LKAAGEEMGRARKFLLALSLAAAALGCGDRD